MNGRMYDPVISSFLSVDRYVQQPENSQGFNRYAYCMYNPLKYIDPSGWTVLGASMGSHTTGAAEWGTNYCPVYEPRDLGLLQLPENAEPTSYYRGNDLEGGNGGSSNSGDGKGNTNTTPDDPPGSQKNNNQQLKERANDATTVVGIDATIVEKAAKLTWLMEGETAGLAKIMKVTSRVSTAGLIINIAFDFEQANEGEITWQSFTMRTMVSGAEYTCFKIPHVVSALLGTGLLLYDITGGFENTLYNDAWLHEHISPYIAPMRNNLTPKYSEYGQMPIYYRHGK